MPGRVEDRPWQQMVAPTPVPEVARMPVNEVSSNVTAPFSASNPPPHPPQEPNRDWAYREH